MSDNNDFEYVNPITGVVFLESELLSKWTAIEKQEKLFSQAIERELLKIESAKELAESAITSIKADIKNLESEKNRLQVDIQKLNAAKQKDAARLEFEKYGIDIEGVKPIRKPVFKEITIEEMKENAKSMQALSIKKDELEGQKKNLSCQIKSIDEEIESIIERNAKEGDTFEVECVKVYPDNGGDPFYLDYISGLPVEVDKRSHERSLF